jgi:hypothetical protein
MLKVLAAFRKKLIFDFPLPPLPKNAIKIIIKWKKKSSVEFNRILQYGVWYYFELHIDSKEHQSF